jgi:hypothetical protein
MKRNSALKVVNPILGLLVFGQIIGGLSNDLLPEETFLFLHGSNGILIGIVAIVHLSLNWNWVKANFLQKSGSGS